jgi:hypothetical protein
MGNPAIANLQVEEDSTFPDFSRYLHDFCRLNLQPIQALKGKSNPKQAYPKCNFTSSSSITQQKIPMTP